MVFTTMDEFQQTTLITFLTLIPGLFGKDRLISVQFFKAGTINAAGSSGETFINHGIIKADNFKQLRTAIAGNRRNPHF